MMRARYVSLSLVAVAAAAVYAARRTPHSPLATRSGAASSVTVSSSGEIDPSRPECPHEWTGSRLPPTKEKAQRGALMISIPASGLSVPGPQTNIPEFNDCQRLVYSDASTGRLHYGPLMAVFATYKPESLAVAPDSATLRSDKVIAAAEILDYDGTIGYDPLKIGPLFNCLFVWGISGALHARMQAVGGTESDCAKSYDPSAVPGNDLAVHEVRSSEFHTPDDFPSAARWDWDRTTNVHYIGIPCGTAWCEIGPGKVDKPATPAFKPSDPYGAPAGESHGVRRVGFVKGWYDEQYLAMEVSGTSVLTELRGTIFPAEDLGGTDPKGHSGDWFVMAHVALEKPAPGTLDTELKYYRDKFNLDPVPRHASPSAMNHIQMCYGTRSKCGLPPSATASMIASCKGTALTDGAARYWARITSRLRPPMYRCVNYHEHLGAHIAPTARWRWLASDETSWDYCPAGCCETAGN